MERKKNMYRTRDYRTLKENVDNRKKDFDNVLYCKALNELLADGILDEEKVNFCFCNL